MNQFACRYAVVQFLPYSEVGEFVNVGIVLLCPQTGYFDFRLESSKHARVTSFFSEISADVYRQAIQLIKNELKRVALVMADAPQVGKADFLRQVFDGLVFPRETIIRFSLTRAIMTNDPAKELDRQFDYHVNRSFTKEYVETKMARRIREFLHTLPLTHPFRARRVGDDGVHADFPLVQSLEKKPVKIIKPFNLGQSDANSIYAHGDAWLSKLQRLRNRQQLPEHILFAVAQPSVEDAKRVRASSEICAELQGLGVQVVQEEEHPKIADFALA